MSFVFKGYEDEDRRLLGIGYEHLHFVSKVKRGNEKVTTLKTIFQTMCKGKEQREAVILENLSGYIGAGEKTLLLGPPGKYLSN